MKKHLKQTVIKSITKIKSEDSYDLEIKDNHNFFANDILVHNCRGITIIDDKGQVTMWSRGGKVIETMSKITDEVKSLGLKSWVLDGEICLINPDGSDNFSGIMSEVHKKNHICLNPRYKIFDMIHLDDFTNGYSTVKLSTRLTYLRVNILKDRRYSTLELLDQELVKNEEDFTNWAKTVADNKWEGFMLRKDVGYEGKRSKNLLKVKTFLDAEYVVKSVEFGDHRIIKDGKEVVERMLANFIIEHKGHEVSVGSGFTHEQRRYYVAHPFELIGKTVTVKYFEESTDKHGKLSLRFPTLTYIYPGKRTT